jgi:hypothetical protein
VTLEEQIWLTECIYLADYFKLRKKKKKQNDPISWCAPGLLSYSYYFAYIPPDNLFPRPIVNLVGGLFWILWDFNVSQQVNKYQSFATMELYLTNPGEKTGLAIKRHVEVPENPK